MSNLGMFVRTHNHKECFMDVTAQLHVQMPETTFCIIRNTSLQQLRFLILSVNRSDTLSDIKLVSVWNETTQFTENK